MAYIINASRRMAELINGLLALARLRKSGQATGLISFEDLLHEAESSPQAAIRENSACVEHGHLPALLIDRVQFTQLFQNLISNAIKYRREEAPRVRVDARREGANWIFSVPDNSRGFEPRHAERIFGLFQRLQGRDPDGTGLGYLSRERSWNGMGGEYGRNRHWGPALSFISACQLVWK